jgi:hypothetical protein
MTREYLTFFTSQLSKEKYKLLNETAHNILGKGQNITFGLIEMGIRKGEINLDEANSDLLGEWIFEKLLTICMLVERRARTQITYDIRELLSKNKSELKEIKRAGKIFNKAINKTIIRLR